jgi:8-oxo-dGTP diphosphatase
VPSGAREPRPARRSGSCHVHVTVETAGAEINRPIAVLFCAAKPVTAYRPDGTVVRMSCYTGGYSGTLAASSEIDELAWFCYADRARVPPVDQLLFDDLNAAGELR